MSMWHSSPEPPKSLVEWQLLKWTFVIAMVGAAIFHFGWSVCAGTPTEAAYLIARGLGCLVLLAGVCVVTRLLEWFVP